MYKSLGSGISYRKNKDKTFTYYFSYREKEKVKRVKLFKKDNLNQRNLREAILKIETILKITKEKKQVILNDLADTYFQMLKNKSLGQLKRKYSYLSDIDFNKNIDVKTKSHRTKTQQGFYNKHIKNTIIGKSEIENIDRELFTDFVNTVLNMKKLSEKSIYDLISLLKTICNYSILLKTICNYSIEINLIDNNPFNYFKIKHPHRKRQRYLNINELELLLKTTKEYISNPNVYMAIYLAVLTAGRAKTVLNIQKRHISFDDNKILLDNFKTSKIYYVAIPEKASEWLKKMTKDLEYNDYLIHKKYQKENPLRTIPVKVYKIMDELFNKHLNKQNNLDRDNVVNFHTLRRSIATNMALEKIDIYKIMLFLDHSSIKQTRDYLNLKNMDISTDIENLHSKIFKNF